MTSRGIIALAIACGGCAALSNVSPLGDGAYVTVVRSNDVNARPQEQQARAMSQASAFCAERGATVEVVRQVASSPPPGQPPSAELDFRCRPKG
jgi:putative hemolysin